MRLHVLLCLAVLSACTPTPNQYRSEVIYGFVAQCVATGGTVQRCTCTMDEIRGRVDEPTFLAADVQMKSGRIPTSTAKWIAEAQSACL